MIKYNYLLVYRYIVYKLPGGDEFYYMDVDKPSWQKSQKTMRDTGHAVYDTLAQVYQV